MSKRRIINGQTLTQPQFRDKVCDAVCQITEWFPEESGARIEEIIKQLGDPPELQPGPGRDDLVDCLNGWAAKKPGYLIRTAHGAYREGAKSKVGGRTAKARDEGVAVNILKSNGGFMEASDFTKALGLGETTRGPHGVEVFHDHQARRVFMKHLVDSKLVRCDMRTRRYHLAPELLNTIVLEPRWMCATRSWNARLFSTYRAVAEAGGPSRMEDRWLRDIPFRFKVIGSMVKVCRTSGRVAVESLMNDSDFATALSAALIRYVGMSAHEDGIERDRSKAMAQLYEAFEDGDEAAHQAMRTPFYLALGRLLGCDPVAMSRGDIIRAVDVDQEAGSRFSAETIDALALAVAEMATELAAAA